MTAAVHVHLMEEHPETDGRALRQEGCVVTEVYGELSSVWIGRWRDSFDSC
jgi:hypothetical protein